LVSIVIITYNSAKYVLETLESVKAQTYEKIELVISDDCSTDDTVEVCQRWIEENKDRFIATKIVTVAKNTGVAPNCNRGVRASKGEWLKLCAGDDLLLPECIQDNLQFSIRYKHIKIFISNMIVFLDGTFPRKSLK
jgi:alpha-1,3-rhamnosyltransferase